METIVKMAYWKGEKYWVGKLLEYPEIMTQGEILTGKNNRFHGTAKSTGTFSGI